MSNMRCQHLIELCVSRMSLVMMAALALFALPVVGQTSAQVNGDSKARFDSLWSSAVALQDAHQYAKAAAAFRAILAEYPDHQRTAVRIAICEENAGLTSRAIDSYQAAIDMSPYGMWADVALFYQARACSEFGCAPTALDAVNTLAERFPESAWNAHGRLLKAQLNRTPTAAAQAELALELAADEEFASAVALGRAESDQKQLARLDSLINNFPNSSVALTAKERCGHILIRQGRTADAIAEFENLLIDLQSASPEARIVQTARTRLAALYHVSGRREDALIEFEELAQTATDLAVRSNAALQASGLDMELTIQRVERGSPVTPAEWNRVRDRCRQVGALPSASQLEKARARLIMMESFLWQGKYSAALAEAQRLLDDLEVPSRRADAELSAAISVSARPDAAVTESLALPAEVAMAHLVAGECLQQKHLHQEALAHFRRVVELFGDKEFMPRLTNTQRTHYRIYEALHRGSGTEADVAAAAAYVLQRWPQSTYADLIRSDGVN